MVFKICSVACAVLLAGAAMGSERLKISGCSISRQGYLEDLARVYEKKTGTKVLLKGGGSVVGLVNLRSGDVDLAATCRPQIAGDPSRLNWTPVAWDAIVYISHPDNPVRGLSQQQARDVYLGKITDWSELGAPARPIALHLQRTVQGLQGIEWFIVEKVLQGKTIALENPHLKASASSGLLEEAVARDPDAFAATGFTSARKKRGSLKILPVDGAPATRANIVSGAYPASLRRHLYLVSRIPPAAPVTRFVSFVLSADGQREINRIGAIALGDIR